MEESHVDDISFEEIGKIRTNLFDFGEELKTEECREIATVFTLSMRRALHIYMFSLQLVWESSLLTASVLRTRIAQGLSIDDDSKDDTAEFQKAVDETFHKIWNEVGQRAEDAGMKGPEDIGVLFSAEFIRNAQRDELKFGDHVKDGTQAVMATLLSTSYAAFVTLAADLWIAAVNKHPHLAQNCIDKYAGSDTPTRNVGQILYETNRVNLKSYNGIREAYASAFKGAITAVLEPEIFLVERVCSLLAHRGGVIDKEFEIEIGKLQSLAPNLFPLADIEIGKHIKFHGSQVRTVIDGLSGCASRLLTLVDRWDDRFLKPETGNA